MSVEFMQYYIAVMRDNSSANKENAIFLNVNQRLIGAPSNNNVS